MRRFAFLLVLLAAPIVGCDDDPAARIGSYGKATFAGGCYWCMQPAFDGLEGVVRVRAGHAGEGTAWREAVEILYDPRVISYEELLENFWRNIDPLDDEGQFCDRGSEYRSGIFVHDDIQKRLAERSKDRIEHAKGIVVATRIIESDVFEEAAESEQNYAAIHPVRYRFYRINCGRDARLHELWGVKSGEAGNRSASGRDDE